MNLGGIGSGGEVKRECRINFRRRMYVNITKSSIGKKLDVDPRSFSHVGKVGST